MSFAATHYRPYWGSSTEFPVKKSLPVIDEMNDLALFSFDNINGGRFGGFWERIHLVVIRK